VITVPAASGPDAGLTDVITGAATYVKALSILAVPPIVVTERLCAPTCPAGVTAVIEVGDKTTTLVAPALPTFTVVVSVKLFPVIVIAVPAGSGPETGLTKERVGATT